MKWTSLLKMAVCNHSHSDLTMSMPVPTNRPKKRRRTDRLCEGDVDTADAFMVDTQLQESEQGPVRHITRTPVWTNRPPTPDPLIAATDTPGIETPAADVPEICGMDYEGPTTKTGRVSRHSTPSLYWQPHAP